LPRFFTGTALVLSAPSTRARLAAAIDAVSLAALFASRPTTGADVRR
jgi:hypothetical protein